MRSPFKKSERVKRHKFGAKLFSRQSAFNKSSLRRIANSLGRFLSIVLIAALGIGFFGGVNSTGGAMLKSAEAAFEEAELSDLRLISPLGFKSESLEKIKSVKGIEQIQIQYFLDLYVRRQEKNGVARFISLPPEGGLNQLTVVDGRLPERSDEIVVDLSAKRLYGFEIGSSLSWEAESAKRGGIDLEDLSDAFEEEEPKPSGTNRELFGPVVAQGSANEPAENNLTDGPSDKQKSGGKAKKQKDKQEESSDDEFDFKLPPALKELAELDMSELEPAELSKELTKEQRELLDLKAEDVLSDESDALIQLAKSLGDRTLKRETYTIVGFVTSPVYLTYEHDLSNLGGGKVDFNAYVNADEFNLQDPNLLAIKIEGADNYRAFSKHYRNFIYTRRDQLDKLGSVELAERTRDIRSSLSEKKRLLREAKAANKRIMQVAEDKIEHFGKLLEAAKPELAGLEKRAEKELDLGEKRLASGKEELSEARRKYQEGLLKYQEAKTEFELKGLELSMAETQLAFAREGLNAINNEINSLQPLLNTLDGQIKQLDYKINALENLILSITLGPLTIDEYIVIKSTCENIDPLLGSAIAVINPYDPSSGAQIRAAIAASVAAAKISREQTMALYNYQNQRMQNFFTRIANAEAEVANKQALVTSGKAAWEAGKTELASAKKKLQKAAKKIEKGEKELALGEQKLSKGKDSLTRDFLTARLRVEGGTEELAKAKERFDAAKVRYAGQIDFADQALAEAEKILLELPSGWFVFDRYDNPGYLSFKSDVDRVSAVARVFPIFLFLVAALVCLTTMTRLIEEDRVEIGVLKATGYTAKQIASRYLRYALLATLGGALLGGLIGPLIFPSAIMNSYSQLYQSIPFKIDFELRFVLIAATLQLICTLAATYAAISSELREQPAALLQPKAPKPGKRIFLERLPFIWKRLSFTKKLTARNIFRYKARMAMIIAGISGCTALLFTAFGIRNSVYDMRDKQFNELWLMDGIAVLSNEGVEKGEETLDELAKIGGISRMLPLSSKSMVMEPQTGEITEGEDPEHVNFNVNLLVANDDSRFRELIVLRTIHSHEPIDLPEEGIVLTQKLADELGYQPGDTVLLKDSEGRRYRTKLYAITENYLEHFAYMSPRAYAKMSYRQAKFNTIYYSYERGMEKSAREAATAEMIAKDEILAVREMSVLVAEITDLISSIAAVILVLFLTAAALAFVVLYNLANINITERQREIATFRVLGFQDLEVSTYIFREMTILTAISAVVGIFLGLALHRYIISTMAVDVILFGQRVHWWSYIAAFAMTLVFAQLVNFAMYFKIKKINMVEALKGVE